MIQRIQSVYLLIAAIATVILLFMPLGYIYTNDYAFIYNAFVIKDVTPDASVLSSTIYIGILLIVCTALSVIAIFSYKNRPRQIKIVYADMIIFLFTILLMLYIYPDIVIPKMGIFQRGFDFQFNPWILIPLVPAAVCLFLANKAIKKDENMVKAADRLR